MVTLDYTALLLPSAQASLQGEGMSTCTGTIRGGPLVCQKHPTLRQKPKSGLPAKSEWQGTPLDMGESQATASDPVLLASGATFWLLWELSDTLTQLQNVIVSSLGAYNYPFTRKLP